MTKVINLYGGPGTGKSTSAALLYAFLKIAGKNAELVREYVKDWAWEGRKIGDFDQIYLLGKGVRKESLLYGKADWVVTDSPVMLGIYYARRYAPKEVAAAVQTSAINFYQAAEKQGVQHYHVMLERTKAYNPAGRYQTEEEAKQIDTELQKILRSFGIPYEVCGTDPQDLLDLLGTLGLDGDALMDVLDKFNELC